MHTSHSSAPRRAMVALNAYHYRRGGADTVFLAQNALLASAGWEVAPFAMQHPDNLPSPWASFFADEVEFGRGYSLAGKMHRAGKIVYSFEARRKLARLLDVVQPSVVHAHNVYHHLSPSVFAAVRERGIPLALTLHDWKILCPAYRMTGPQGPCERCKGGAIHNVLLGRCVKDSVALSALVLVESAMHRMLGLYARHVSRFIAPSRFLLEKCVEWGWPRERFVHIPNFVDVTRVTPFTQAGDIILYAGRLAPEKGLATLVRAAARARVPVWLAGEGPERAALEHLARGLGAPVSFLGRLAPTALAEAAAHARAFVLPSEWYENAPMSILEAYAFGRPVIGARIGGIPELIRENETGFSFQSGSVEALAAALARMVKIPDRRVVAMGGEGRRWVARAFNAELYRDRLLTLYAELHQLEHRSAHDKPTPKIA